VRLKAGHATEEIPLGPFRVWADTGRVRLVCFALRRGRSEPACRYFEVDTLIDESGRRQRRLRFLNWVTEHGTATPETWTERTS
jgi:hypothetical protein